MLTRVEPALPVPAVASAAVVEGEAELSIRTADRFARAVREVLGAPPRAALLSLEETKIVDVVGLATLAQAVSRLGEGGSMVTVAASPAVLYGALDAGLLDKLPLASHRQLDPAPPPCRRDEERATDPCGVVARGDDFVLRRPRWDDLVFFDRWAHDDDVRALVGSELLYRCRHLGPFHPDVAAAVLHHPTSLTLVVQPADGPEVPHGFVRLYGINLGQGFGFLESTVVSRHALRRGWGVAASRLLSFYACDVLGIRRIEAKVYDYNRLSVNALKRNGFCEEGVLRQAARQDGCTSDILVFAILEDDIRAQRAREGYPDMGFWRG